MSDYKTYEIENAIKLIRRRKIVTTVKHFAEMSRSRSPHLIRPQHKAEMDAIDLILDILAVELSKQNQKFKIRRTTI